MIGDLKPYPSMKDSSLPWVGEIPEHWGLAPNRTLMRKRKVLVGEHHTNYKLLSLTKRGVIIRDVESGAGKFSADMGTSQEVRSGDLVFCLFDVPETPRTVGLSPHDGMITGAYTVFECDEPLCASFIDAFYRAMDDRKLLSPLYSGLRNTIPPSRLLGTMTPVPPPKEQGAIVKYLGYADTRIRRLLRAKRRLIALLTEQKQAIIHRTFTRGLNLNVPMKDAGAEWLGQVPKHWSVVRVKDCAKRISKGTTPSTEGREILDSGPVRFLKAENITSAGVQGKPACFIDEETDSLLRRSSLRKDDVLFVIAGATLGKTSIVSENILPANTNQAVSFIRPKMIVNPRYLELWLQSPRIKEQTWLNAVQSAQPNLSMADLGRFPCPLPALPEQEAIVESLEDASAGIDTTIARAQREIELLSEYRTRLVADIVTGKLDVREAAASLPNHNLLGGEDGMDDTLESDAEERLADLDTTPHGAEA